MSTYFVPLNGESLKYIVISPPYVSASVYYAGYNNVLVKVATQHNLTAFITGIRSGSNIFYEDQVSFVSSHL